jgi:hypothetical protein
MTLAVGIYESYYYVVLEKSSIALSEDYGKLHIGYSLLLSAFNSEFFF